MEDYQKRVIEEKQELDRKIGKLTSFLDSIPGKSLNGDESERMKRQLTLMGNYSDVLGERMESF